MKGKARQGGSRHTGEGIRLRPGSDIAVLFVREERNGGMRANHLAVRSLSASSLMSSAQRRACA